MTLVCVAEIVGCDQGKRDDDTNGPPAFRNSVHSAPFSFCDKSGELVNMLKVICIPARNWLISANVGGGRKDR